MSPRLRRPGSPWRILVHEWISARRSDGVRYGTGTYGTSHRVSNDPAFGGLTQDGPHVNNVTLSGTEFDELVIGRWIHLEQMDATQWWLAIGGVTVLVTADRDGRPRRVSVFGPHDYDGPVEGCTYELKWTEAQR
jgi:hypothetical protein